MEEEEPTLPRLPVSLPANTRRKRGRKAESSPPHSATSSDPAIFSSDDDPTLDNYQNEGRRKRRYVGTWFDQHPASSDSGVGEDTPVSYPPPRRVGDPAQHPKREFKRQLDSGVWMGTDGTMSDTDDAVDMEPAAARLPLPPAPARATMPLSPTRPPPTWAERIAYSKIRTCVENGWEEVDLSGLALETIPEGLLEPISDISPIPNVAKDVAFEQRDPQIKVFLSSTQLTSFPLALLNVEHLTVLSLRSNQLARIPPAIAKLRNLEHLNVAQNELRFLPGELLGLLQKGSKLRNLNFLPNRFWQPDLDTALAVGWGANEYEERTFGPRPNVKVRPDWYGLTTRVRFRTPVQFMDSTGATLSRFALPDLKPGTIQDSSLELEPFTELAAPRDLEMQLHSRTTSSTVKAKGVKSLFELALGTCVASGQLDVVMAWLREGGERPKHLAAAVERAADICHEKGLNCSVCGRQTIAPVAQWVEFRHIGRTTVFLDTDRFTALGEAGQAVPVPFLRVGCSWNCVPMKIERRVDEN
ncbi:uncharacterized protein B0T15DRAFT_489572 [Chaetomium strumarium]|uniref:Leucine rich repeat domain-containing protein n=1 Tax=Chaetomium strumarium TaxID=1170767 RepID=A0AAJ0H326_9PEZI|nr:hypothetical protein B0T15DRAFT_489572 [Chaetomium strumarium]